MSEPEPKKPNGRKYTLTKAGMAMMGAALAGNMWLAYRGKMTPDIASVTTVFMGALAGLIGAFQAANAYVSGKTEPLRIQQEDG